MTDRVRWREEPDGFRYLHVDYRDADAAERDDVFRASGAELVANPGMRSLVEIGDMEHDPAWFKGVKDAARTFAKRGLRMAVLCDRKDSAARIRMLAYLGGADNAQPFHDQAEALAWLRQE